MKYFIMSLLWLTLSVGACKYFPKKEMKSSQTLQKYTCPMHPQIKEDKPGKCPICHMDLVPIVQNTAEASDEIHLSAEQMLLGNIQVDTIKNGSIGKEMIFTGVLNFDQSKKSSLSARTMGRIDRLYFKNEGDYVSKGSPLYDIYSENLNIAKKEYVDALERKVIFNQNALVDYDHLIESAKQKLVLLGMLDSQIDELSKNKEINSLTTFYSPSSGYVTNIQAVEGTYVMEGGTVLSLANLNTIWVETQVYSSQLAQVSVNDQVLVKIPELENKVFKGKITFENPEMNTDSRINLVRIVLQNTQHELKPGMPAYVFIQKPKKQSLTLPIDAVLRNGKQMESVWIKTKEGTFKNRMVKTGLENDFTVEILDGLMEGDRVVTSGAYLLNSEYVFKNGAEPMVGMDMNMNHMNVPEKMADDEKIKK